MLSARDISKQFRISATGMNSTASVKNIGFSSSNLQNQKNRDGPTNNRLYSAEGTHRYKLNNRRLKPNATQGGIGLPDIRGAGSGNLMNEEGPGLLSP